MTDSNGAVRRTLGFLLRDTSRLRAAAKPILAQDWLRLEQIFHLFSPGNTDSTADGADILPDQTNAASFIRRQFHSGRVGRHRPVVNSQ